MADISTDPYAWSSTASSNSPSGSTVIGSGLDDNLRAIQAAVKSAILALTSVSGTNTITATAGNVAAYATGQYFVFVPAVTNTAATTLNVNSLGAKSIFNGGAALLGGELRAGWAYLVEYDGTQFNLIGNPPAYQTGTIVDNAAAINLFAPMVSTGVYLVMVGTSDNNVRASCMVCSASSTIVVSTIVSSGTLTFSLSGLQLKFAIAGVGSNLTYYAGAIRLA